MDLLLIIGLILWIVGKAGQQNRSHKQRESARARARAAALAAEEVTAHAEVKQQQPIQPTAAQTPAVHPIEPLLTTMQQRRHPLEASKKAGHAHMETSMTGIGKDCPPAAAVLTTKPPEIAIPIASAESTFRFDPARAREGLIYAEILGKPKALRR